MGDVDGSAARLRCPVCGAERVAADEGRIACANRECEAFAVPVDRDVSPAAQMRGGSTYSRDAGGAA